MMRTGIRWLLAMKAACGETLYEHTITNNPATFTTEVAKKLKGFTIPFTPVQSGSGDPAPDNVRAITGWTGLNIYQSGEDTSDPETIAVSWSTEAGTVYGGELNVLTGVLTVTHKMVDLTSQTGWVKSSSYPGGFYINTANLGLKAQKPFICSHAKTVNSVSEYVYGTCFCDSSANIRIMESGSELTDWTTYRETQSQNGTPVCIAGQMRESITVQLDPVTVTALVGENNIWTNTNGDNTIKYLSKTKPVGLGGGLGGGFGSGTETPSEPEEPSEEPGE